LLAHVAIVITVSEVKSYGCKFEDWKTWASGPPRSRQLAEKFSAWAVAPAHRGALEVLELTQEEWDSTHENTALAKKNEDSTIQLQGIEFDFGDFTFPNRSR